MEDSQTSAFESHCHILAILAVVRVANRPVSLETVIQQANLPLSKHEAIRFVDFLTASEYLKMRVINNTVHYWKHFTSGPYPPILFTPDV